MKSLRKPDAACHLRLGTLLIFTEKAVLLLKDSRMRDEMASNGRKAVMEKYNRNVDGKRLLGVYDDLLKES